MHKPSYHLLVVTVSVTTRSNYVSNPEKTAVYYAPGESARTIIKRPDHGEDVPVKFLNEFLGHHDNLVLVSSHVFFEDETALKIHFVLAEME